MYLILAIKTIAWDLGQSEFQAAGERKTNNFLAILENSLTSRISRKENPYAVFERNVTDATFLVLTTVARIQSLSGSSENY